MRAVEISSRQGDEQGEVHNQLFDALAATQFARLGKNGNLGHRRLTTSEEEQEALLEEINSDFVVYCKQLMSLF